MQAFAVGFSKHPVRVTLWPSLPSLTILTWKIAMAFVSMWNVLIFKFQKAKKTTFLGTRKIGWIFPRSTEIIIIIIIFFSN